VLNEEARDSTLMKVNMVGPATERTGYGIHFVNLAKALGKKIEVSVTARSQVDPMLTRDLSFMRLVDIPFDYGAPTINIWFADNLHLSTGKTRIGFPVFETDQLNEQEYHHIQNQDVLFVASEWAKSVVCSINTPINPDIFVVREGFNPAIFKPREVRESHMTIGWKRPYVQNIGKWEGRKGHPELIEALGMLADGGFEFTFLGMWHNTFQTDWQGHADHHLARAGFRQTQGGMYDKGNVKVVLASRVESHQELANIISMCDFGVYPHMGEGWGLPILETMGSGRPVVATNYSGPTEYLHESSAVLIEPSGLRPIYDPVFFQSGRLGNWAVVETNAVFQAMAKMLNMTNASRFAMGMAAHEIASHFTWDDSADRVIEVLRKL